MPEETQLLLQQAPLLGPGPLGALQALELQASAPGLQARPLLLLLLLLLLLGALEDRPPAGTRLTLLVSCCGLFALRVQIDMLHNICPMRAVGLQYLLNTC